MQRIALVIVIGLFVSGCFRVTYNLTDEKSAKSSNASNSASYDAAKWNNYFMLGTLPVQSRYGLAELCPRGTAIKIRSLQRPENILSGLLSLQLSSASTVEVTCSPKT